MLGYQQPDFAKALRWGVVAGAAGGLAEIVWVSAYALATGMDAAIVARGVTTAVGITALLPQTSVLLGVFIHMALAVVLGTVLAAAWQKLPGARYPLTVAALAGVWMMNFFVVLPLLSPDFIQLLPYTVSLVSKLLFGFAAAEVLRRASLASAAVPAGA